MGLGTGQCCPRVLSNHSVCVCLCVCLCAFSLPRWMKKPRCGVPDHPHLSRRRRNKRYALTGQKWRQKHITYRCCGPLSSSLVWPPGSLCSSFPSFWGSHGSYVSGSVRVRTEARHVDIKMRGWEPVNLSSLWPPQVTPPSGFLVCLVLWDSLVVFCPVPYSFTEHGVWIV